jgi:hypothetical protein
MWIFREPKKAAQPKADGVREGSKTATLLALIQRPTVRRPRRSVADSSAERWARRWDAQ